MKTRGTLLAAAAVGALAFATAAPAHAATWTMPNLIGANLQDAQNAIQSATDFAVFYTASTDLTGADRAQIVDSNWQVCASSPLPGATFTESTAINFGVVQLDEACP